MIPHAGSLSCRLYPTPPPASPNEPLDETIVLSLHDPPPSYACLVMCPMTIISLVHPVPNPYIA